MKKLIFLLFLLPIFVYSTTYYVRVGGGTGSGLDDANAWSYAKLNSMTPAAGDNILFKKGELYRGAILTPTSGNSSNPITYGSYGTGANPILSGFVQPTSWTLSSGNIYYTTLTINRLSMVTVDGVVKGMGRYPKTGYLQYTWHYENAFVGGTSVTTLPLDFNGGEVVVKKFRWIIDRHPNIIIADDAIQYDAGFNMDFYGYNGTNVPTDLNGYFIQNHLNCLTQDGEWSYDVATKRLYMYFASGPTGRAVNAVNITRITDLTERSYLNFTDIDFEGGDYGIYMTASHHINISGCKFRSQGMGGIYGQGTESGEAPNKIIVLNNNVAVNNCEIREGNNNGITGEVHCPKWTITNNKLYNNGTIPGMSKSGDGAAMGIVVVGDSLVVENNEIIKSGYCGVSFDGNGVVVTKNFIDSFCLVKDDGGGIYTYLGMNPSITYNIVLHGIGNHEGVGWDATEDDIGKGAGIYLDNGVSFHNAVVTNNTVAHGDYGGIFINNVGDELVTNNLVYDRQRGIFITDYINPNTQQFNIRDITVTNNTVVVKNADHHCLFIQLGSPDDIALLGIIDSNIYARPIDDGKTMRLFKGYQNTGVDYSLKGWETKFGIDSFSKKSKVTINNENKFRFEYNKTNAPVTVALDGIYYDVAGNKYTTEFVLAGYSAKVLLKYVPLIITRNGKPLKFGSKVAVKKQVFQ